MKIQLFHGVGHESTDPHWLDDWKAAITAGLQKNGYTEPPEIGDPVLYDDLFEQHMEPTQEYLEAIYDLLSAWAFPPTPSPTPGARGLIDDIENAFHNVTNFFTSIPDEIHWRAGIVAEWIVKDQLRAELRARFSEKIRAFNPDLICAHSHGSLICYDLFTHNSDGPPVIAGRNFLSFGSQIGHPAVVARVWGGRIKMLDQAKLWYHLWNHNDPVFTHDIKLPGVANYQQTTTLFGNWFLDVSAHSPVATNGHPGYLDHPATVDNMWRAIANAKPARAMAVGFAVAAGDQNKLNRESLNLKESLATVRKASGPPTRRALLIGINKYPDPANRLEGCVNDTFLISEVLQERGFAPEDIRVLLDDRATHDAILDRLAWLVDGARDGQERVLFYSGHGAQIPAYGAKQEVDHLDECLVPWDFDWSESTAITDKQFYRFYSQLPYETRFISIFDCCHSGGMTRDGSSKIRGLTPPDDIRHRILQWNADRKTWEGRTLPDRSAVIADDPELKRKYLSENGATNRLGRAMPLRRLPKAKYDEVRDLRDHEGPYLPVLLEACREDQFSYEYRHGATSYGAFTYSLVHDLRRISRRSQPTFAQLIKAAATSLRRLRYDQTPQLVGPKSIVTLPIPGS